MKGGIALMWLSKLDGTRAGSDWEDGAAATRLSEIKIGRVDAHSRNQLRNVSLIDGGVFDGQRALLKRRFQRLAGSDCGIKSRRKSRRRDVAHTVFHDDHGRNRRQQGLLCAYAFASVQNNDARRHVDRGERLGKNVERQNLPFRPCDLGVIDSEAAAVAVTRKCTIPGA